MSYFDENYRDYNAQNPPRKLRYYLNIVQKYTPSGASLFEIGVGKGLFLEQAHRAGYAVQGCDIDAEGIAVSRDRLPDIPLHHESFPNIDMPLQGTIVAFDVIEHIPNLDQYLMAIKERLLPEGVFIFVCPVYDGPLGWIVRWLDKDPTHVHKNARYWWLNQLRNNGFRILEWRGLMRYLLPGKHYLHSEMHGPFRHLAPAILGVCARA